MKRICKNSRGFTLTELVIVLALLSIVSLLIVSFSSMTSAYSIRIDKNLKSVEEVSYLENFIDIFVSTADSENYNFYVKLDNGTSTLFVVEKNIIVEDPNTYELGSNSIYLTFDSNEKILKGRTTAAPADSGDNIHVAFQMLENVDFSFIINDSDNHIPGGLVKCAIRYNFTRTNSTERLKTLTYFRAVRAANAPRTVTDSVTEAEMGGAGS